MQASSAGFMSYVNLVLMVVVMMTMVAIIAVSVVPVVRPVIGVAIIWLVVAVWIIAVPITISVSRIPNSDSDPSNADCYLSVRTLDGHKK